MAPSDLALPRDVTFAVRNTTLWPGFTFEFRRRTRRFRSRDFRTVR